MLRFYQLLPDKMVRLIMIVHSQISYDEETVQSLKLLYNEIESEKDWDLNLTSLRQVF